ncbi:unnamed protein product [Adineta steineri]|uniref:Citrate transporter-like domain-containing protein n=2 Tax=Adineta steineri TaxID=433720 RepID=A0A814Q4D0_9BILA|nr:unnamed protein product [Adineta steineri]
MENTTNTTTTTTTTTTTIPSPHVYQVVVGCIAFFLILPFVLVPITRYPLGSTGAVLVGAFLMVATTVIDQTRVYTVIGDMNNLKTIFLLCGMMAISSYFERERLIDFLFNKLFPPGLKFHWWLLRLSIIDSIVAALFTNDVACVILTPLILNKWIEQKRDKSELNTLLLTLATQANIGSTLTIFGNPQMALIASKSNVFVDTNSRFELKTCVEYLWIPTFIVWLLNLIFLFTYHHLIQCRRKNRALPEDTSSNINVVDQEQVEEEEEQQSSVAVTTESKKLPRFTERFRLKRLGNNSEQISSRLSTTSPVTIDRSVSIPSFSNFDLISNADEKEFQPSGSRLFKSILFILLITVIALLFASNDKVYFDIGLIPIAAAIILFVADTLINHRPPTIILMRIDWNVLLLFFGLFVWLDGLNSTGIPHKIWVALKLNSASLTDIKSLLIFYIFTLIGSNIFSNVPLTLLVLEQVPPTGDHLSLVLYLAFITTIAGNLTLFGSVANLIVAQKALTSSLQHKFDFWTYLKFGFLTTILLSLVGTFIIFGLLRVIH